MKQISSCLNGSLTQIMQQVARHQAINAMLHEFLPDALRPHCVMSQFEAGCLTIAVTDPVWLTLLRYQVPALRTFLRQEKKLHQLASIELVLQPGLATAAPVPVTRRPHVLSQTARDMIQEGSSMIQFEPLARALKQLGTTND